jgi:hypothetical protein
MAIFNSYVKLPEGRFRTNLATFMGLETSMLSYYEVQTQQTGTPNYHKPVAGNYEPT